jgi:3'-5' exoribonuclease
MSNKGFEAEGGREKVFIKDLREGDQVYGTFAVRRKEPPRDYRNKTGKYFIMEVGDRTGDMVLKFWGGSAPDLTLDVYRGLEPGDVVLITGTVAEDKFEDRLVILVDEGANVIRPVTSDFRPEDYLPSSDMDLEALMRRVLDFVESIKEPNLRALLDSFFGDEGFVAGFMRAPSAVVHHHNYLGGNIEHIVGVLEICECLCKVHGGLDRDLLIAGALLHDIGKIRTYRCTTFIDMTDEGRFISHALIGERMVRRAIDGIDGFPEELAMRLSHMVIKHMGKYEDIGVQGMRTIEALALHLADNADAQIKEYRQEMARGRQLGSGPWYYSRTFKGPVYLK